MMSFMDFLIKILYLVSCIFDQTMIGSSPQYYMPSFLEIGPPVLEKIFEGFLPYMGVTAILVM